MSHLVWSRVGSLNGGMPTSQAVTVFLECSMQNKSGGAVQAMVSPLVLGLQHVISFAAVWSKPNFSTFCEFLGSAVTFVAIILSCFVLHRSFYLHL